MVKGRALGDMTRDTISTSMRSVYPDFVVKRRPGVAAVEEVLSDGELQDDAGVQGFDDIELFLADYITSDDLPEEQFDEEQIAEVLATTWREKRAEINKLQKQRKFTDARDLRRSFRVEIEEMKKKTKCHRCGRTGHWSRECRQKRDFSGKGKPSGSGAKGSGGGKGMSSESGAALVSTEATAEPFFVASVFSEMTLLDKVRQAAAPVGSDFGLPNSVDEVLLVSSPGYGVLDSGCGKTIIGEDTLQQFEDLWIKAGVKLPVERSETNQFRFGNGQVETFSRLVDLPVGLAGKSGILQAAVVRGAAPLLVSRPALKRLGATINFAEDRLKLFHDRLELPLRVNAAGQYMVDVMQFDGLVGSCESNAATSVPPVPESCNLPTPKVQRDEPHVNLKTSPPISHKPKTDNLPVETTLVTESFPIVTDNISQSTKNGGISKKQLRNLKSQVKRANKPLGQKYAVVEVFSPPRVVPQVEKMGLRGLSVDIKQGWDLTDPVTQSWLMRELAEFPPELLILCPPCTDAGGWFHLNKYYMTMQDYLRRKRALRIFKDFCKQLMKQQIAAGGRFVFEHPVGSEVWRDPEMQQFCKDLCSFTTDMCCFDLHLPSTADRAKARIRKTTRLLVSHHDMKEHLCRQCPGESDAKHAHHAQIAGSHPTVGKVSVHAGKYTLQFVEAMLRSVPALRSEEVLLIESPEDNVLISEVLAAEAEAVSDAKLEAVLKRLHNNLGHPSPSELVRVLKHGQASDRALGLAAKFKCSVCESMKGPAIANPANPSYVSVFNHKIGIDVKHLQGWQLNQKIRALNIVDYASNFQMMIPFFETETAAVLRRLLNERWLAWAGTPREIVMDPARTNIGKALTEPCELEGTHVSMTAAGAHWQLGKTEVHGGLFAKVLSKVLSERNPTSKGQWLDCVRHCHVKNSTIQTHGFTPSQVVFGKNPDLPGELLTEPQNAVSCTAGLLEESVEQAQALRHAAKKAILELQDDKSMRRALAARPRLARNFRAGDIVAYWRDQKWTQGKLSKGGRWYGSAVVIGLIGKNVVIAHRSHVLRCAPEQLRLATPEEKQLIDTPETQLLGVKDMLEGGTFRSSQYVDLLHQAYPSVEHDVMRELESTGETPDSPKADVPMPDGDIAPVPDTANSGPVPAPNPVGIFNDEPAPDSTSVPEIEENAKANEPSVNVESPQVEPAAASSSSAGPSPKSVVVDKSPASTYGPLRRVPSKTGPFALHRPMPVQHEDFVEVLTEVLPKMLEDAVQSTKRGATESTEEPQPKVPRRENEQLSVQPSACDDGSLTTADARELWNNLQNGATHEVLYAQYLQKRMQKELHHSNNEPWLQGQVDAAKIAEWNTLSEKQAVRLLSSAEAAWVKKHTPNRIMGSRFVLTRKAQEDIIETGQTPDVNNHEHWKVKARWCLQGHLDPDLSSKAVSGMLQSPTLSQMGRMVLFQLLSSNKWVLQLGDIKGAFLEAGPLDPKYKPLYAWLPAGGIPGAERCTCGMVQSVRLRSVENRF